MEDFLVVGAAMIEVQEVGVAVAKVLTVGVAMIEVNVGVGD